MSRAGEEAQRVLPGEMRDEPGDPGEVEAAVAKHVEDHRVLPGGPGRSDSHVGLGLREVKHLDAVLANMEGEA